MKSKYKSLIEKIINFLLNILIFVFGIILIISVYTSFQTKVLNKDYTDFFGYSLFEVQTGSMKKAINPGDWIIVKITKDVKLNDVITYRLNHEYITHRLIEIYTDKYVTKGDANNAKDDAINQKQIVGKVVNILPNFGVLRKTIFNPPVLIALIVTLFLFNLAFTKNNKLNFKKGIDFIVQKYKKLIKKEEKSNKKEIPPILKVEEVKQDAEIDEEKEEELEKTSVYRVISIDSSDVDEDIIEDNNDLSESNKDDLDKTSMFRVITVDKSEIDKTLLEIAENKIKISNNAPKEVSEEEIKDEEEPKEENLTNIDLELLKNKNKKGKNTIDSVMIIKKEELSEILNTILIKKNMKVNNTIKDSYVNAYINYKYYNIFDENDNHRRSFSSDIKKVILRVTNELKNSYNGNDLKYKELVDLYSKIFLLISNFEIAKESINELKVKREYYKDELLNVFEDMNKNELNTIIESIIDIQNKYDNTIKYFLEKLETTTFSIKYNELKYDKNINVVDLVHNISFNKVYSEYIIDKTYSEGIIAEDKIEILLMLLLLKILNDIFNSNFNKKYILYVPESLYSKDKKIKKILKLLDDNYLKNNIYILIKYRAMKKYFEKIKEIKQKGYKFSLVFEPGDILKESDKGSIYVADYVFINKKLIDDKQIVPFIPNELISKIINEDVESMVGGFGGE